MQIARLDHVNIRTTRLDTLIEWYTAVLGLRQGARPDFPFPGAWLYAGEDAVVHLVGIDGTPGVGSEVRLKLEHFAFSGNGRAGFEQNLRARGERYERSDVPSFDLVQINLWDPDGNHIHVDFPADE